MAQFLLSEYVRTSPTSMSESYKHGVVVAKTIEQAAKKLGLKVNRILKGAYCSASKECAYLEKSFRLEKLPEIKKLPAPAKW